MHTLSLHDALPISPKARPKGVVDGKSVNIPILVYDAMEGRRRLCQPSDGYLGERM